MFFFACDMGGKIKPNKTIKNVLGLIEGEIFLQVKKLLNFFACYLEERNIFKTTGKSNLNFTYIGRGQNITQNSSNCPKEYEGIFLLQKNMKGVDM